MSFAQKQQSGFTLMEILVVVSVIAILSTLGLVNYKTATDRARHAATLDEMREYGTQSGIARGDTGIFWKLRDLQSDTMPVFDVYGHQVLGAVSIDTQLWKGPYLNLQKTGQFSGKAKFDAQGNPMDVWGDNYQVALLKINGNTTTLMNDPNDSPASHPSASYIISWGPDKEPGSAKDGIPLSTKSTQYWLYFNEPSSDDIYYQF